MKFTVLRTTYRKILPRHKY